MERTSLDWAHLFINGLSCDIKSRCYDAIFDSGRSSVLNEVVTSAIHSYTDLYSS